MWRRGEHRRDGFRHTVRPRYAGPLRCHCRKPIGTAPVLHAAEHCDTRRVQLRAGGRKRVRIAWWVATRFWAQRQGSAECGLMSAWFHP
eukprot:UN1282